MKSKFRSIVFLFMLFIILIDIPFFIGCEPSSPNGDVYADVDGGDIYKQTGGTGNFVALSQTSRYWYGMAADSTGNVYACVESNDDIYKQTDGTGDFVALGETPRNWHGICVDINDNVYACVFNGDIYTEHKACRVRSKN